MPLENLENGTLLMNGTEQDLFVPKTNLNHYSVWLFMDELVAGDEIIVKVIVKDPNDSAEKSYRTTPVEGKLTDPAVLVNWIPMDFYKITLQQITGTNRTIGFLIQTS